MLVAAVLGFWVTVGDPGNPPDTTPLNQNGTSGQCQDGALCQSDNNCVDGGHPPPCDKFEWPEHMQSRGAVDYVYQYQRLATTVAEYVTYLNAIGVTPADADDPLRVLPSVAIEGRPPTADLPHGFPPLVAWSGSAWQALEPDFPWPYATRSAAFRYINWFGTGDPDLGCYDCTAGVCDPARLVDIAVREVGVCAPTIHEQEKATHWDQDLRIWRPWSSGFIPLAGPPGVGDANVASSPALGDGQGRCGSGLESPNAVCNWVPVDSYPQSDSYYGVRGFCGNGYALTETCGELLGVEDCSRMVLRGQHPWLAATDCQLARPQQGFAEGVAQAGTEIRMVRDPSAIASTCYNGADDDGDGRVDLDDPGCLDASDDSERSDALVCDNGVDDDGDGRSDFDPVTAADPLFQAGVGDPGCRVPEAGREDPECQDGVDNDGGGGTDFDGGASVGLEPPDPAGADPECVGAAWRHNESPTRCGAGAELLLLAPALAALRRRRISAMR